MYSPSRYGPDLILADLRMPVMDGLSMIAALREMSTETPVIVVSGTGTVQHAVDSLRLGAWDYVIKLVENTKAFEVVIERALEKARLLKENRLYRSRAGVACFHLQCFRPRKLQGVVE